MDQDNSQREDTGRIDYTGEDTWTFKTPFGKGTHIARPDVTAYAAEYGFMVSNKFVVVVGKYDEAESADEIMARNQGSKNILKIKSTGKALKKGEGEEKEGDDDE